MASESKNRILLSFSFFLLLMGQSSYSRTLDKLLQGQKLKDGDELVSALGTFRLGFFSPLASTNRYVGIWYFLPTESSHDVHYHLADGYYQKDKPVWVANRDDPISNKSGKLMINSDGNLIIVRDGGEPIPISSLQKGRHTIATLLQSGNLVLQEKNSKRILWQSFDFPTDTLLPGMKLGINLQTRQEWFIQSWTDIDSPAKGEFTLRVEPNVTKSLINYKQGEVYWNSGLWLNDKQKFNCSKDSWALNRYYNFSYTSNKQEKYFDHHSVSQDSFPILRMNPDGAITNGKGLFISCTKYGGCWEVHNQVQAPLCGSRSPDDYLDRWLASRGFMSADGFKFNQSDNMNYSDCQLQCIKNCSCVAFAPTASNFTGCEIWSNGTNYEKRLTPDARFLFLLDEVFGPETSIKKEGISISTPWLISGTVGAILFILLSSWSSLIIWRKYKANGIEEKWWMLLIIAIGVALLIPPVCCLSYLILKKLRRKVQSMVNRRKLLRELATTIKRGTRIGRRKRRKKKSMDQEFYIFDFQTVEAATNKFSTENKIGEGGFGPVYKGKLEDGQEVAIKRLSRTSRQGIREFKNEVKLIAKLQHTNLVKLLGCSLYKEERILVYEYMHNKSLDFFIFDSERKKLLNWKKRLSIIEGTAQALLYLQKFSRLKVIHRDLKANNILLDDQMNPKLSDFGMARICGMNKSELKTQRIAGTFGYMSPEYIASGFFSTKSDVYSFGVLILEIVSSKKNRGSYGSEGSLNLAGYAWQLWNEGKALELVDSELDGPSSSSGEVMRCIHVGLLCVQDQPKDRPTMSDVISMLPNEVRVLPAPKQPAFFNKVPENVSRNCAAATVNEVTISVVEAR